MTSVRVGGVHTLRRGHLQALGGRHALEGQGGRGFTTNQNINGNQESLGDAGPDEAPRHSDLVTAEALGRRVAEVTRDYVAGRRSRGQLAEEHVAYATGAT